MGYLEEDAYDLIIVGLGGMGSAVAAHAARRGLRVLGLEQFGPLHDRGASTGKSRIIRKAYFEDARYVPMLLRAYELWRELETATGLDILRVTGMLMIGQPESPMLRGAAQSADLHGLTVAELSGDAVARRYPMIALRPGEIALLEPDAGFVRPETAIEAHLQVARRHGATLQFDAPVSGWEATGNTAACVHLAGGRRFATRNLALCMGPWFVDYAATLGVQLRVQRNVQMWFDAPQRFAVGSLPVFFVDRPDYPKQLYGFPDIGEGVKAAFHGYGETTRPQSLQRDVSTAEVDEVRYALNDFLPGAGGTLRASKVCMYSLTPDEHFVIARLGQATNVVVAGGFSGHGFKFCSAIGELVTDLVQGEAGRFDISFLSPDRFAAARTGGEH